MTSDDETIWSDHPWFQQMFPARPGDSSFIRWKKTSTGLNITRQMWDARSRAVADLAAGLWRGGSWPTDHVPVVLWIPIAGNGACLGCLWLHEGSAKVNVCATAAVAHCLSAAGGREPSFGIGNLPVYARNAPHDEPAPEWGRPRRRWL